MKSLLCVVALSLFLCPACNTEPKTVSQNENKEVDAARQEKQIYQDKIEARLRDLDQQIDDLKVKLGKQSKVDRKQLDQEMAELDRKRAIAHQKFERLENSSQEAWQDMKIGIDAALDDLEAACRQAGSHFK